jgi:(1->4)-alpha-D-glucan 1-alpha-D-glucosylmutase
MLALSTHDTKRSEDVRARLALLSEQPERWAEQVRQWRRRNAVHRRDGWPDGGTEHVIYQTLLGAHPLPLDRMLSYALKAVREAKVFTSWTAAHPAYEEALETFLKALDADQGFQAELAAWADELRPLGQATSMAQKLVELTVPGVPDTYQGTEIWDLSLVDPDNRRPVDYERRAALLDELLAGLSPDAILERADEGLPKLWVVHRALHTRAERAEAFGPGGGYEPLTARGASAAHVVAFERGGEVAVVVPRLVVGLSQRGWGDTTVTLADGAWRNELTGEAVAGGEVRVADLLARFPVALLTKEPS